MNSNMADIKARTCTHILSKPVNAHISYALYTRADNWACAYKDANVRVHGDASQGINYSYRKLNQWNMQIAAVLQVED